MSDEVWSEEHNLLVRIYRPPLSSSSNDERLKRLLPCVLDLHGGMWIQNDRSLDEICNKALAEAGFVVAAFDFRQGPAHPHPAASQDSVGALVWLRDNADRLSIDPDRIGILGSSSGGHLAMVAGLTPNNSNSNSNSNNSNKHHGHGIDNDNGTQQQQQSIIAPPKFIIALWPVSCPSMRYRYAKRAKIQRLIDAHESYFVTQDNMRDASVPRLVISGEAESLPPLLVVQPGEDGNIPPEIYATLLRSYQDRGGYYECGYFPGEAHAFGLTEGPSTQRMIDLVISFAKRFS